MIKNFKNKVAVVTGAGSGIGRSLAIAFAKEKMKVVIVDVNQDNLDKVSKEIEDIGVEVMSKVVDVSDREQMAKLADEAYNRFGRVNVLCNNAGIGTGGPVSDMHLENWDWIISVNLYGVIYGIHFFLKRMIESGEECHIVNTSSVAGLAANAQETLYSVTKYGVVALSEGLYLQLRIQNPKVGVSVLCPGFISTGIIDNSQKLAEKKQDLYQPPDEMQEFIEPIFENVQKRLHQGMHPDVVAQMVINSIQENRLYIITHPNFLQFFELRLNMMQNDALNLNKAMKSHGLIHDNKEIEIYTHPEPKFSISYPANWVTQKPTFLMNFDFMASSDTVYPNIIIRILDMPEGGLSKSIEMIAQIISAAMAEETRVIFSEETNLNDNTPALQGEIEILLPGGNQFISTVLNTVKGDKLISITLTSLKLKYDSDMKKMLQDIAYTLTFN